VCVKACHSAVNALRLTVLPVDVVIYYIFRELNRCVDVSTPAVLECVAAPAVYGVDAPGTYYLGNMVLLHVRVLHAQFT
jgi:hypothetical protein